MVDFIHNGTSSKFIANVESLWESTPRPLAALVRERDWHVETLARAPHMPKTMAFVAPNKRTLNYVERVRPIRFLPAMRLRTSPYTHYHEIGHFLDLSDSAPQPFSETDEFSNLVEKDLERIKPEHETVLRLYFVSLLQTPEQMRSEVFADLFAENILAINTPLHRLRAALPNASQAVWERTKPLVYGR